MVSMLSPTIRGGLREIAQEKYGIAPMYMVRTTEATPALQVQKGDLVVYVKTAPSPGEPVAVDRNGGVGFERWDPGRGTRVKGVILTVIRELGR
jgi:hypothetical protein